MARILIVLALLMVSVNSENSTITHDETSDTCEVIGPWSQALEDWATFTQSDRHGRIMALPPTKGYYVTERIDTPYLAPPPPPISHLQTPGYTSSNQGHMPPSDSYLPQNQGHMSPSQGHIPLSQGHMSPSQGHIPLNQGHIPPNPSQMLHKKGHFPSKKSPPPHNNAQSYKEWEVSQPPAGGKIVNRPPNKDKNKPNYPVDRVDDPPRKQVSETDLYLLGAIEKLVYRADRMEKRLRAVEDSLHELLAAGAAGQESCPSQFTRVGSTCYSFNTAQDWKRAATACRAQRGALAELLDNKQRRAVFSKLLADKTLKGNDFWTGGLNPGLLWIWSHSARPVGLDDNNTTTTTNNSTNTNNNIPGEGRCLSLLFDPARNSYSYRGRDCSTQLRYICQLEDDREEISNDIQRAARKLRGGRRSKLLWD